MSGAIAREAQAIVFEAAKPIRPGSTVKAQIREAARALGYPEGSWRISAAWYGHADSFSAAAIRELQDRYLAWRTAEARRATAASEVEQARQLALDRDLLERCRRDHLAQLATIESRLAALGPAGSDASA